MSLKHFHVFFIATVLALMAFLAYWSGQRALINEGSWRDSLWKDGWTVVTADGRRSAQFEHTVLVTETGVEILTLL